MQGSSPSESNLIQNPFIKKRHRNWEVEPPRSLVVPISPPRGSKSNATATIYADEDEKDKKKISSKDVVAELGGKNKQQDEDYTEPALRSAAVEAGEGAIRDHLRYFTTQLTSRIRPMPSNPAGPPETRLSIQDFVDLYQRNQNPGGHHFVIHQHDHPVAGTHYDIRLQFSETSSISFACMYGLPGNPNSMRLNRNATETRVHNVWNHLIETASHNTGSLLIWDIGEYEVLHRRSKHDPRLDPDSASSRSSSEEREDIKIAPTEPEKLAVAFKNRKIKLRFHGTKLPKNYTLLLRLTKKENRHSQPKKPVRKRRRKGATSLQKSKEPEETPPSSETEAPDEAVDDDIVPSQPQTTEGGKETTAMEKELQEQEDEMVRLTNAYPGATNTIGSIHQRKWYLSIDRVASGFYKATKNPIRWERKRDDYGVLLGWEPFFVNGRDTERSVVTGRIADEVLADEGVEGFVGRKGWRAVLE